MSEECLQDDHSVLRYVGHSKLDGGKVKWQAFEDEKSISVNWLECVEGSKDIQIDCVRKLVRQRRGAHAVLAEIKVNAIRGMSCIDVELDPLRPDPDIGWPLEAPCHANIVETPQNRSDRIVIYSYLAEHVVNTYPARAENESP